jgi:hypothetical protein
MSGRVFGICVEKNAELLEGDPSRKYKGRVVFQGNQVLDQKLGGCYVSGAFELSRHTRGGEDGGCLWALPWS